jgi:hypothetical protein
MKLSDLCCELALQSAMKLLRCGGKTFFLFALALILGVQVRASEVTLGTAVPDDGDCAPWGCTPTYQQVYSAASFGSSAIIITGLTFFKS